MSRCIPPPANDNALDKLYPSQRDNIPVDRDNPNLTEADAVLSDVGSYDDWRALAKRLKESERGQQGGLTGITKKKRVTR